MAVAVPGDEPQVRPLLLSGSRKQIRDQSVDAVLGLLRETLAAVPAPPA